MKRNKSQNQNRSQTQSQSIKMALIAMLSLSLVFATSCAGRKKAADTVNTPVVESKQVIEASGKVKAGSMKDIVLDFGATVQDIHVEEGQKVEEGQALLTLDLSDVQQQINSKENDISSAQLQLTKNQQAYQDGNKETSRSIQSTQNTLQSDEKELQRMKDELQTKQNNLANHNDPEIRRLENSLQIAQDAYQNSQEDYYNKQTLYTAGAITRNELEQAQRTMEDKQKQVNDAQLTLNNTINSKNDEIDKLQSSIAQKAAQVENEKLTLSTATTQTLTDVEMQKQKIISLQDDLQQFKNKLSKSFIRGNQIISDIKNGVVYDIQHNVGNMIQSGTKLLSIADMDSLEIEAEVSEEFIKNVKVGAEVKIHPTSDASKEYTGKVTKIADMGTEKNGDTVVLTQISIENNDGFLRPNFNVDVEISK